MDLFFTLHHLGMLCPRGSPPWNILTGPFTLGSSWVCPVGGTCRDWRMEGERNECIYSPSFLYKAAMAWSHSRRPFSIAPALSTFPQALPSLPFQPGFIMPLQLLQSLGCFPSLIGFPQPFLHLYKFFIY